MQQLLVRGLFKPETELLTVEVRLPHASHMAHPNISVQEHAYDKLDACCDHVLMMGCGAQVMAQVMQQLAAAGEPPRQALVAAWVQPGGGAGGVALAEVLGDLKAQLALSLAALLPWLCLHFRHSPHAPLAALCILVCPLTAAARHSFAFLLTTTRCPRCSPGAGSCAGMLSGWAA